MPGERHGLGAAARLLASRRAAQWVWIPLVLTSALHYGVTDLDHWVHDLARRLFYVPVVLGGVLAGPLGGLLTSLAVALAYLPHALLQHQVMLAPGLHAEKLLELVFYPVLGGLSGVLTQRLRRQRLALERAARLESLGQLTAGLAHEIKNPLHTMRQTAEYLQDHVPRDHEDRAMVEAHLGEIDRLTRFLSHYLAFARGRPGPRREVPLATIVQAAADLLRTQAARQGTDFQVCLGPGSVHADADQLVGVVLGLGLNALQALEQGGRVVLEVTEDGLLVRNDGPPISEKDQSRLFDPFFTRRASGTGLGLSVAWRVIAAHGGSLEVRSDPSWTVFRARLQVAAG